MMDTVFVLEQSRVQPKVATMTADGENGANPIEMFAPVDYLPALSQPALYTLRRVRCVRDDHVLLRSCWVASPAILTASSVLVTLFGRCQLSTDLPIVC
jgi:hypothetical protein